MSQHQDKEAEYQRVAVVTGSSSGIGKETSLTLAKEQFGKELEKGGILERHAYHEIPSRVEYRLTAKGQELVESVISLLQWMRKWSKPV